MDVTPVYLKNVSRHGVGLLTLRRFEPGTVLVLELSLDVPHSVSLFARVVRLAAHGDGQWLVGCALLGEMSDEDFKVCGSLKAKPSGQERRVGVRLPDRLIAVCRRVSVGALGQWAAEVQDLSPAGLKLINPCDFEEGASLKVDLPAWGGQPARTMLVRVVRRERQANGKWLLGCEICPPQKSEVRDQRSEVRSQRSGRGASV
jgi:hypothetical protein